MLSRLTWGIIALFLLAAPFVLGQEDDTIAVLAWHPSDDQIAVALPTHDIEIRSTSQQVLMTLSGHTDNILDLEWNNNGTQLASVSRDGSIRLWDTRPGATQRLYLTISDPQDYSFAVAWNPTDTQIITSSYDGLENTDLHQWNAVNGQLIGESSWGTSGDVAWSQDGNTLASATFGGVAFFSAVSLDRIKNVTNSELGGQGYDTQQVAWHTSDSDIIAAGLLNGIIRIWNITNEQIVIDLDANEAELEWPENASEVLDLTFTDDGTKLYSISADGTFRAWETNNWQVIQDVIVSDRIHAAAFHLDGGRLVYANGTQVEIIRPASAAGDDDAAALRASLTDPNCQQACYLGMEPGVTTLAEVENILQAQGVYNEPIIGLGPNSPPRGYVFLPPATYSFIRIDSWLAQVGVYEDAVTQINLPLEVAVDVVIDAFGSPDHVRRSERNSSYTELIYQDEGLVFSVYDDNLGTTRGVFLVNSPGTDEFANSPRTAPVDQPCTTYGEPPCIAPTATP